MKQEKLDSAELLNRKQIELSSEDSRKNQSFADSMTTKIIDNLQVTIKNVHVRYEDSISSPGNPFSVGLTLSEFSANSTDSQWQAAFVQGSDDFTYKLAKLGSLAVYWNTDTQSLAGKTQDEFLKAFSQLISTETEIQENQYILRPVSGTGRVTINKLKLHDRPKTDVSLSFDELAFAVDQDQYRDALQMVDTFHFFLRHQEYRKYRPSTTVSEDPKAWLKFALTSVRQGIHNKNVVWTWDHMKERRDTRKRYVELFKKKQSETIVLEESAELKKKEEKLSYEDIRFYRSLARNQLKKENALRPKQVAKQAQGWISWAWSGSTATADQADASEGDSTIMTEQQRKELYDALDWNEKQALSEGIDAPEDSIQLNISARLKRGSFTLKRSKFHDSEDVLQLLFETFGAHFKQRPTSMFVDVALDSMRIIDGTTPDTLYREIVKVKDDHSLEGPDSSTVSKIENPNSEDAEILDPLFYASFENHPLSGVAQTEVVARLKALEIVYNVYCVETLLNFVKPPKSQMESITALMEVAGEAAKDFRESGRASLEFALSEHKTIAAHLDLQAPLIIVPESCTDKGAACVVLDAGKIHIESNLVEQSKIKELQAKNNQQLTDVDMRELQALCYDKFQLRLESTQILIGPSVSKALVALRSQTDRNYHVVDKINMEFLLEISILPKTASLTLTKFRISGHLPTLSARVSDAKYKTMMRIIDVAIPKDEPSGGEVSRPSSASDIALPSSRGRAFSTAFGKRPDLVVFPEKEEDENGDDDDDDKFVQARMNLDEKDLLFRQKIFEFRFTVGELRGSLFKASQHAEDDGELLVDIVLQQFALDFVLRQYDMQADVVLKSFVVEDRMSTECPPEFQRLVTSEQIGEEDQVQEDLVRVKYIQVKPESPEFQSVYGGVEKNVNVALSTINLIVTQKSILTLFDFILTTFTDPDVPNAVDVAAKDSAAKSIVSESSGVSEDSKMRVKVELTSIVLVLNQDGIRLATLKMSKGDVGVFLNGSTLRVSAKLGNLSVRDDVNQGSEVSSSFRQIISIEGDELVDFRYETFDQNIPATFPGYDSSVFLRLNSVKINFLEEPLRKILNFGSKFARMKALFDDARAAALSQVQQAQERAGRMHFDVLVRTPIVVFPRISTQTSERDVLVANLGELFAKNSFMTLDDRETSPTTNKIHAGIRHISLFSKFHYPNDKEELQMIDDADAIFDIDIVERQPGSSVPTMRVVGNVSDIKLKVTQSQYKFLIDLSQSIPMIFADDEADAEEVELGQSLSVQLDQKQTTGPTTISDLEPELGNVIENGQRAEVYTTLDADFTVGDLVMEIFSNKEDSPIGDLERASLSKFSLNSTKAKFSSRSDQSNQGELNIKSFTVVDTRHNKTNKFREVIPAITHDGHQFNASVTISGGLERALMAMLTIDTPRMIFSLEHLFALQRWGLSAFSDDAINTPSNFELDQVVTQSAGPQKITFPDDTGLSTQLTKTGQSKSARRRSSTPQPHVPEEKSNAAAMSVAYRVNVVDPSIILVADNSKGDSDAIVLSAKQVLLVQQTVLMLNVDKVGMYMSKMNELDKRRLRVLDDFSMSLSLDSKTNEARQCIQIIAIDVEPLGLRLSLRDIMLVMQIANTAAKLSSEGVPPPNEKKPTSDNRRGSASLAPPGSGTRRKSLGNLSKMKSTVANQSLATKIKDDKSVLSDTEDHGPVKSAIINREELRATFEGLRLVLIGDIHELPMVDMSVDQFVVKVKDWSSEVRAGPNSLRRYSDVVDVY